MSKLLHAWFLAIAAVLVVSGAAPNAARAAAATVTVDMAGNNGTPTNRATGFLYGLTNDAAQPPADKFDARLGLDVWASAEVAQWVRAGDERAISLDVAQAAGIYPPEYRFRACLVAHVVEDNVPFTIGNTTFTPLATPGHADGHIAYMLYDGARRCLFIGDLLCGGRVLLQATYDCCPQVLAQSLLRLADQQIDALFPGHLHFLLGAGQTQIDAANVSTRKLLLPL